MNVYSDGVVERALVFLGYSTANVRRFMSTAMSIDKQAAVEDAVFLGFDAEQARALDIQNTANQNKQRR